MTTPLEGALVRSLDAAEITRAFAVAVVGLLREVRHAVPALAERIEGPLMEMTVQVP